MLHELEAVHMLMKQGQAEDDGTGTFVAMPISVC
jgi:hypothetical protein